MSGIFDLGNGGGGGGFVFTEGGGGGGGFLAFRVLDFPAGTICQKICISIYFLKIYVSKVIPIF